MKRLPRPERKPLRTVQEGSWAVSYGDMITLLLGFYIMYFSIDPPKKNNTTLTSSLITALEKLDEQVTVDKNQKAAAAQKADDPVATQAQNVEVETQATQTGSAGTEQAPEKKSRKRGKQKKLAGEMDSTGTLQSIMEILLPKDWVDKINSHKMSAKQPLNQEKPDASMNMMKSKVTDATREGAPSGSAAVTPKSSGYRPEVTELHALDAEASRIGDRVYIMFPKVSFFASASTEITPEGRRALEKFSKVYLPFAGKALLNIVGFSDERPVKAVYRFRDNLELSVLRAVSAQRVAESVGIPLSRTRLMGHGINTQLIEGEEAATALDRWALTRKIMLVIEPEVP